MNIYNNNYPGTALFGTPRLRCCCGALWIEPVHQGPHSDETSHPYSPLVVNWMVPLKSQALAFVLQSRIPHMPITRGDTGMHKMKAHTIDSVSGQYLCFEIMVFYIMISNIVWFIDCLNLY